MACSQTESAPPDRYTGMCDASAAIAIDNRRFAVADDEDNRLRIYARDRYGPPLQVQDLSIPLDLDLKSSETDLEGAARIGETVYWIASHGRNKDGEARPNRGRFFATKFKRSERAVSLEFVGTPYRNLLQDLIGAPQLQRFNLAAASRRAPKERGALNIEGLCSTPENRLLIAFRNPVPNQRALLVPLLNPDELVAGQPAKLGEPILLDLGGLGVREMTFHEGTYLIIGGSFDGSGRSKLFTWKGGSAKPERVSEIKFKNFNPEAILVYPDKGFADVQILSDDGTSKVRGIDCKRLKDDSAKRFRDVWVQL